MLCAATDIPGPSPSQGRYREHHDCRRRELHRPCRAPDRGSTQPSRRVDRQGFGGPDGQQRVPGHVFPNRRDATHRRRQRRRDPARADRPVRSDAVPDRDQPPAPGSLAGAVRGGLLDRCADRRPRTRRRAAAGQAGPDPGQRRHDQDRRAVVRRHPSAGPHPRIGRAGPRRGRRRDPPVHRRLPVSRRRRQDVAGGRLREAARRRHQPGVRRLRRLDGRLSRPRRRHHAGHRAATPRRMERRAVGDGRTTRRSPSSPGPAEAPDSGSPTRSAATVAPSMSPAAPRSPASLRSAARSTRPPSW